MPKYNKPAACVMDDGFQTLAFVKVEGWLQMCDFMSGTGVIQQQLSVSFQRL